MESKIVAEFMQQTGCEIETAYTFLQAKRWDLQAALDNWHFLNEQSKTHTIHNVSANRRQNESDGSFESDRLQRGTLQKSKAIDLQDNKKLFRGISRATDNVPLVNRARNAIAQDFEINPCYRIDRYFIETPEYTFTLPDLNVYGTDFKIFLEKDLIEKSALLSLEQSGRLNWWADYGLCQRLWPLSTSGDGNCLLHAASLAMWGFHDRLLTLRKALYAFLKESDCRNALYRRWRWQQTRINAQSGFVYSEDEWQLEWETIINMASTEPRREKNGRRISSSIPEYEIETTVATYESLEEIHVLALAHVLKRPIIVIADLMLKDMNGEPIAPIPFGGIYLPFEIPSAECHRSPLLLTYDMAHFSALVAMDKEHGSDKVLQPPAMIPLVDSNNCLLPIQFNVDPGENFHWGHDENEQQIINTLVLTEKAHILLLKQYLDVVEMSVPGTPTGDDEGFSEDEIEKKFSEIREFTDDTTETNIFSNRNRAAKQLQSVAKQFGSIGKSMSRKLKKNFGKITNSKPTTNKRTNDTIDGIFNYRGTKVLCAHLHMKRHEYQNEMVQNYLQFAQTRFLNELQTQCKNHENLKLHEQALLEGPTKCINTECNNFGTAVTSYMCQKCFDLQCKEELSQIHHNNTIQNNMNNEQHQHGQHQHQHQARYGTGKSKFYRECDIESHNQIKRLPSTKRTNNSNHTLYLSKSTFYNDTGTPFLTHSTTDDDSTINRLDHHHHETMSNSQSLDSSFRSRAGDDTMLPTTNLNKSQSIPKSSEMLTNNYTRNNKYFDLGNNCSNVNIVDTKLNKEVKRQQHVPSVVIM